MPSDRAAQRMACGVSVAIVFTLVAWVAANHGTGMGNSFTFLEENCKFAAPGAQCFFQEIFGVSDLTGDPDTPDDDQILGGVAFAADGDPWVSDCDSPQASLHRFDGQEVAGEVHMTRLHPETVVAGVNSGGCGLVNGTDGFLYSNTRNGVRRIDANSGASSPAPLGLINSVPGNTLGIAVDPQTSNLYYVAAECDRDERGDCPIHEIKTNGDPVRTIVVEATDASWVDGLYFDPTGNFIFLANRQNDTDEDNPPEGLDEFRLTILTRVCRTKPNDPTCYGDVVQHVQMTHEPDGVAFHPGDPLVDGDEFVVTNNTNNPGPDGTISRFDFPGNEFTTPTVEQVFASGGFRGDLMQVGPDGCLYLTQAQTRYDDLFVSDEEEKDKNSLVRICERNGPGFVPPPGVAPPPPPPPSGCKMTGGGEFNNNAGQLDSFGLIAQTKKNGVDSGHFNLVNHATRLHVNGAVTEINCGDPGTHTLEFIGTDTKRGCTFTVKVQDNGEPGTEDKLLVVTLTGNTSCLNQVTSEVKLRNGNLQFHPTHD